jgi:hypothetical protein
MFAVEPVKASRLQQEPKTARIVPDAELVESILTDPTLRRGDVVEFPDGPRVYRGSGRFSAHRVIDFEQVREAGPVGSTALAGGQPIAGAYHPHTAKRRDARLPAPSPSSPVDVTNSSSVLKGR